MDFGLSATGPEHVLYAISQSEARRVLRGEGWGYILGLSHKRGGGGGE